MSDRAPDASHDPDAKTRSRLGTSFAEVSLLDLLLVLHRRRALLGIIVGLGFLISLLLALGSPKIYTAKAKVVPSNTLGSSGEFSALASLRGAAGQLGLDLGGASSNLSTLLPDILSSRDVLWNLFSRSYPTRSGDDVSLLDVYRIRGNSQEERLEIAVSTVGRRLVQPIYDPKSGISTITVSSRDPVLAAAVANAAVEALNLDVQQLKSTQAGDRVRFIARRIAEVQDTLATAEEALMSFREHNRITTNSPGLTLEESRLVRQVTLFEQLFLTLKGQYELARIEQFKNLSDVVVLEKATPPLFRSSPRRLSMVIVGAFFSVFIAVVLIFLLELWIVLRARFAGI